MIDLSYLVPDTDAPNQVVEVYICPSKISDDKAHIPTGWTKAPAFLSKFPGNSNPMKLYEFHHNDLCCSYDRSNDAQRIFRRSIKKQMITGNMYAINVCEEVLPSHKFPCTNDISYECEVTRSSYRINNRMFVHHDEEDGYHHVYLRYQHAPNVDVKKMQDDLDKALGKLTRGRH